MDKAQSTGGPGKSKLDGHEGAIREYLSLGGAEKENY